MIYGTSSRALLRNVKRATVSPSKKATAWSRHSRMSLCQLKDRRPGLPFSHQHVLRLIDLGGDVMAATSIRVVSYHDPPVSLLDLVHRSTFSETTRKDCTESATTHNTLWYFSSLFLTGITRNQLGWQAQELNKMITWRRGSMQLPFDSFPPGIHQGRSGAPAALPPGSGRLAML